MLDVYARPPPASADTVSADEGIGLKAAAGPCTHLARCCGR